MTQQKQSDKGQEDSTAIVALLQWTKTGNGKLPVRAVKPLMRKARPMSLPQKKPEKQATRAVKSKFLYSGAAHHYNYQGCSCLSPRKDEN